MRRIAISPFPTQGNPQVRLPSLWSPRPFQVSVDVRSSLCKARGSAPIAPSTIHSLALLAPTSTKAAAATASGHGTASTLSAPPFPRGTRTAAIREPCGSRVSSRQLLSLTHYGSTFFPDTTNTRKRGFHFKARTASGSNARTISVAAGEGSHLGGGGATPSTHSTQLRGGEGTVGDMGLTHLLAVCRSAEDEQRVAEAARQIAADAAEAGTSPSLAFHISPATSAANANTDGNGDGSGGTLPSYALPALDAAAVSGRLASYGSRTMGRVLLAAAMLGSTQDVLRAHGSVLGGGAVVVADRQTSGKGRGGNQWTSPAGCLMFSALRRLRVTSPTQAPFINYLVCLAVTRGVRRALKESGLPPLDIRIKWPNDIYAEGVKIGGALIHTTWQGGSFNVVTGIGLNVNNRTPTTCLDELLERAMGAGAAADGAASTSTSISISISREAVLAGVLAALEEMFDTFEQQGFSPLEPEYLAAWLHTGQVLDFYDDKGDGNGDSSAAAHDSVAAAAAASGVAGQQPQLSSPPGGQQQQRQGRGVVTRLTVRGLSPGGFLLAEDAWGGRFELTPDGNSLDMMRGLIRRKVN